MDDLEGRFSCSFLLYDRGANLCSTLLFAKGKLPMTSYVLMCVSLAVFCRKYSNQRLVRATYPLLYTGTTTRQPLQAPNTPFRGTEEAFKSLNRPTHDFDRAPYYAMLHFVRDSSRLEQKSQVERHGWITR